MARSLDRVVRGLGGTPAEVVGTLFGRWEEIVGPQIAAHARPVAVREGVLVVTVDDPAWATQVRFLEAEMLRRLVEVTGGGEITSIEVRVRPAHGGSGSAGDPVAGPERS